MVAMAMSLIIIAAIYQHLHFQQQSYITQDQVTEVQENVRATMAFMTRDLQLAGFDPTRTANAGFVSSFPAPNDIFAIDYTADTHIIAFTIDDDSNGMIDANDNEQISYRLNNTTLERFSTTNTAWEPLTSSIDALNFVFLDDNGNLTTTPANFRAVELSILAKTERIDHRYLNTSAYVNQQGQNLCPACDDDHYRRRLLTTTIQLRNIGL
jgi:type IV pilus assembly protein PilW